MKNYGLATLTFVVGVALGVIIGLLVNSGDDSGAEVTALETQLRQVESELEDREAQLDETAELLAASEQGRQAIEQDLEEILDGASGAEQELMAQLEAAQAEVDRLMGEAATSLELFAGAQAAVVPHIFMLEELGAFADAGYDGQQFVDDPAIQDALAELPEEVALVVRQLFAEPDPTTAAAKYRDVVQRVLNSLQAVVTG